MGTGTLLGSRIGKLRRQYGVSQGDLASASRISQGYLSQIESGYAEHPSLYIIQDIVEALRRYGLPNKDVVNLFELSGLRLRQILETLIFGTLMPQYSVLHPTSSFEDEAQMHQRIEQDILSGVHGKDLMNAYRKSMEMEELGNTEADDPYATEYYAGLAALSREFRNKVRNKVLRRFI